MTDALRGLPGWARGTVYACGGAAAAAIQLGSSWSLGSLAWQAGLGWPRLLLLPVALDLGAIVAATLWVAGTGRQRVTGRCATLGLVVSSIGFNAADALAAHGKLNPNQMLTISVVIAMVFPLTAALMGHIVLLVRESDSAAANARARHQEELARAERERQAEVARIAAEAEAKATVLEAEARAKAEAAAAREARKLEAPKRAEPENATVARLPGTSKGEKLEAYIAEKWDAGVERSAAEFERELYGTSTGYGRKAAAALRQRGVLPPSERPPRLTLARS